MPTRLKIAVVEDHEDAREELIIFLRGQGWHAEGADCGEELNKLMDATRFDMVILDLNLPHEDGLSIASRIRQNHPNMGIVILSARTRATDRLEGYQTGADVYLHKPVNLAEILAVINNMAKRLLLVNEDQIRLKLSSSTLIYPEGSQIKLTHTEAQILKLLSQMPSREANHNYLLESLARSGEASMTQENLQVHVSRIRSKTNLTHDQPGIISAIRGYGYKLNVTLVMEN